MQIQEQDDINLIIWIELSAKDDCQKQIQFRFYDPRPIGWLNFRTPSEICMVS